MKRLTIPSSVELVPRSSSKEVPRVDFQPSEGALAFHHIITDGLGV